MEQQSVYPHFLSVTATKQNKTNEKTDKKQLREERLCLAHKPSYRPSLQEDLEHHTQSQEQRG